MLEIKNIEKKFGDTEVLKDINFTVEENSFTVLLGPSGCGKSTLLRIIAGFEEASGGQILINGKDVAKNSPSKRGISIVFQSYALFPHLSVEENIVFGLKIRKVSKEERKKRLDEVAEIMSLKQLLHRKPSELSGGQKQRVALARAIVSQHNICLMDEPLSNLDAKLRNEMRMELKRIQQSLKISVLYVTHDQIEAMSMADKIILLNNGKIEQQGTPNELYNEPASTFVGKFIGTPPMNIITKDQQLIGIRAEDIRISKDMNESKELEATIVYKDFYGADTVIALEINDEQKLLCRVSGKDEHSVGEKVILNWDATNLKKFNHNGLRA